MTIKKQQGGVTTPGVMPYDVIPIQGYSGPEIGMPNPVSAVDPSAAMYKQMQLQQRNDAQKFREEQAAEKELAATQTSFLDKQDKLFGVVHNPYQEEQLANLKSQYNIPDNITADVFRNQYQLKDLEYNFSQAVNSSQYKKIKGEVAVVNKMRDAASKMLTEDEYAAWNEEYNNYQFSKQEYDINKLAPSAFQKKNQLKDTDYATWVRGYSPELREVDISKQANIDSLYDEFATAWAAKGKDEAIRRGYLIDDPKLGLILSDDAKKLVLDETERSVAIKQGRYAEWEKKKLYSDRLGDQNRLQSDAISDENRRESATDPETGETKTGGRKETETEKLSRLELETLEAKYGPIERSSMMDNGMSVKDYMWKAVKEGSVPVAKQAIEKHLQSKGKTPKGVKEIATPNVLGFPNAPASGAMELLGGK